MTKIMWLETISMVVFGLVAFCLVGCETTTDMPKSVQTSHLEVSSDWIGVVNRLTWGINTSTAQYVERVGLRQYLGEQLNPKGSLPAPLAEQIAAMTC